ncbi:hypothetical protein ACFL52_02080 [Candidatus Margulisiibacteriota bacterium]
MFANAIDPLSLGGGARSIAMGRTGVAAAGKLEAIVANPANAAAIKNKSLTTMQTKIAEDVNYNLFSGAAPTRFGNIGISYLTSSVSDIKTTTRDSNNRIIEASSFNYSNSVIALTNSKIINEKTAIGGTFKLFNRSMGASGEASGYDLDLGVHHQIREDLEIGLVAQNLLPSPISHLTWNNGTKEDLLLNLKFGLNYKPKEDFSVLLDIIYPADTSPQLRGGGEYVHNQGLAVRGGFESIPIGINNGYATNLTFGIGLSRAGFSFDYAYFIDQVLYANTTHYFSLTIQAQPLSYSHE